MSYQPAFVDGATVGDSIRPAEPRYRAVADHLGGRRELRVLDFGAWGNYFSARLAYEYGHRVVAVDDSPELEEAPGVEVIRRHLGPSQIRKLGRFDAGLCLSVLHHQPQWRNYLNALVDVCDTLFVEAANPAEILPTAVAHHKSPAIVAELEKRGAQPLCRTPGYDRRYQRTLYVLTNCL